jgi:hypothetical protein
MDSKRQIRRRKKTCSEVREDDVSAANQQCRTVKNDFSSDGSLYGRRRNEIKLHAYKPVVEHFGVSTRCRSTEPKRCNFQGKVDQTREEVHHVPWLPEDSWSPGRNFEVQVCPWSPQAVLLYESYSHINMICKGFLYDLADRDNPRSHLIT